MWCQRELSDFIALFRSGFIFINQAEWILLLAPDLMNSNKNKPKNIWWNFNFQRLNRWHHDKSTLYNNRRARIFHYKNIQKRMLKFRFLISCKSWYPMERSRMTFRLSFSSTQELHFDMSWHLLSKLLIKFVLFYLFYTILDLKWPWMNWRVTFLEKVTCRALRWRTIPLRLATFEIWFQMPSNA